MKMPFKSEKIKLLAWFVGALTMVILLYSGILYYTLANDMMSRLDANLTAMATKQYLEVMDDFEESGRKELPMEELEDIKELREEHYAFPVLYAQLLKMNKDAPNRGASRFEIIIKSLQLKDVSLPHPDFATDTPTASVFSNFSDPRLESENLRLISYPFKLNDTYYVMQFSIPRDVVDETLGDLLMVIFLTIPILPLLFFWGGRLLITRTLAPVKAVVKSARRITTDNLSHRIPAIQSNDEIGQLVETFNAMIDRLETSIAKIKRFSSDVAHEFKTPMTVMRGEIDVLLRKERPLPEYIETLTSFSEEVEVLQKIIDNLLFLDSSESDIGTLTFTDIPLQQVVLQVFESIESNAHAKTISISFGQMDTCYMHGEITLLKRAFFNLMENACKYTPEKGKIEISLKVEDNSVRFSVSDTGIGIPPEHLPHIFDRFFRVDKSRSRRRKGHGSGLGLCLTKRIVKLHNGTINATSTPNKGTTFTVTLPLSPII